MAPVVGIKGQDMSDAQESNENVLKESEEKKKKLRKWKLPNVQLEDSECTPKINFAEFKEKFEAKLTKIENAIPQKIKIKCKGLMGNKVVCSLFCQYFKELEKKGIDDPANLNIFWFEASNKVNFYLQLFDMGLNEEIFHETFENFGNFEEILIRRLTKNITNGFKLMLILNNYNDEINLDKLIHHKGIMCVLISNGTQQRSDQEVKKSERKDYTENTLDKQISVREVKKFEKIESLENAHKIHRFNWDFRRKLKFRYESVPDQESIEMNEYHNTDDRPKTAIIIPTSFVEILKNFRLLHTVPKENSVDERKILKNFLGTFPTPGGEVPADYYYTKNPEILEEILSKICSYVSTCQMSIDWINNKLDGKCTKFEPKFLKFLEILIECLIAPESPAEEDFLKILKERILEVHEHIMPRNRIIVPISFVNMLKDFCKLRKYFQKIDDILTIVQMTKNQFLQLEEKFQNFLTKFQPMGIPAQYYYTKNQKILQEILVEISQNKFSCRFGLIKWFQIVIDWQYKIEKNHLAFVEIMIVSFIAHNYNSLDELLKILGIIDKIGKWFKYFQNMDVVGNYFVNFCKNMEPYKENDKGEKIFNKILIQVIELFVKVYPEIGLVICEQVLVKCKQNSTFLKESVKVPKEIYTLRILKAKCLYKKGQVSDTLKILQDVLKFIGEDYLENLKSFISLTINISKDLIKSPETCQEGYENLVRNKILIRNMGKENSLDFGSTSVLEAIALYQMDKGKYNKALENLEKIQKIQNQCQDGVKNIAKTMILIANVRFNLGQNDWKAQSKDKMKNKDFTENFQNSFKTLTNVMEICIKGDFKLPLANLMFYFKGDLLWESNPNLTEQFVKLLNMYNEFEIFDRKPKSSNSFEIWKSEIQKPIVKTQVSKENDETSKKFIESAKLKNIQISKSIEIREAEIYQWIGHCHCFEGDLHEALKYYEMSENILEKYNNRTNRTVN